MAKLVAAVGVPHGPTLPDEVARAPGKLPAEALMKQVREQLEAAAPDVIIEVASDHLTNFFYNNLPSFCLGLVEEAEGPAETYCPMPHRVVRGQPALARAFLTYSLRSNFDMSATEELRLDHSILVPLHFLTPSMSIPVVPLYVNGLAPPLPRAQRCLALGRALRRFIEEWDGDQRVALLASGAFSLEVGGPKMGVTDLEWVRTIKGLLEQGQYGTLARRATLQRMLAAGNVSGELLNWITVVGALGEARPVFVQTERGRGYAAWRLE
jgi:hypothetical protein